jgi:hypothetical protein
MAHELFSMQQQICHGAYSIGQVQFYLKLNWELHFLTDLPQIFKIFTLTLDM